MLLNILNPEIQMESAVVSGSFYWRNLVKRFANQFAQFRIE